MAIGFGEGSELRRPLGAVRSVLSTDRTRAGVGSPGVQQDRTQPPVGDNTCRPLDRSGSDTVASEHRRCMTGRTVVDDDGYVWEVSGLQPRSNPCCSKPEGSGDA